MGTPDFAAVILEALIESDYPPVAVYSRPDAIRKRGSASSPSPVSQMALNHDIPLFRPKSLREEEAQAQLVELTPDLIVVAAYGMILPREVLDIPSYGCINVHASLLPRWRGAAPVERAILAGDLETGVSIMRMEEGLDTGPYCAVAPTVVENKTAAQLTAELADIGGRLLLDTLPTIFNSDEEWMRQDEELVTYAGKIEKAELKLKPELTAKENSRRIQASSESAPARFELEGRPAIAEVATVVTLEERLEPGTIQIRKHAGTREVFLVCAAPSEVLRLERVKPDNKRSMAAADWLNSFPKGQLKWR
jgi:methionyl-tRNA formyltransferase